MGEKQKVKYVRELTEFWQAYMGEVISEIYAGVGIALGLSQKEAYQQLNRNPKELKKAGFFKKILDRFNRIFDKKIPKFRPKRINITEMSQKQWDKFNNYLDNYWKKVADDITGDVTTKSFLLGRETAEFEKKKKPYKNKSLYQIVKDQYGGDMPDRISKAYKKYDFTNAEKNAYNKQLSNTAMYVTEASNEVKEAIRKIVNQGIEDDKSSAEIASDLYWGVEKDEKFTNKYRADALRRNWSRISITESVSAYEAGKLAAYEAEAMESLKDPSKAKYFTRTGGTCEFCMPLRGTLVRLVPTSIVNDITKESLKEMGIKDPNTDIAIWVGKNNIGISRKEWMVACPAHPHNTATFTPINLEDEFYNPKTDDVEKRQVKKKYVPQMKDYSYQSPEEKESRKPVYISPDIVRYNNNIYRAVEQDDFNRLSKEWEKDPTQPIPVNKKSPQYIQIFEAAERNK